MGAKVHQLNEKPRTEGEAGIPKQEVKTAKITYWGVGNDFNVYRYTAKNNTPEQSVLLHCKEILDVLKSEGWPVEPGHLGENITIEGIGYGSLREGLKMKIGTATIELTKEATPCNTLSVLPYVGKEKISEFISTMKGRRGWYAKVLEEGEVKKGDEVTIL